MDTIAAVGKPYNSLTSVNAVFSPFPFSLRFKETINPTISTFAAPRTFGTVSSIDFPDVVTSSIITTRSPSCSFVPKKLPLSAP